MAVFFSVSATFHHGSVFLCVSHIPSWQCFSLYQPHPIMAIFVCVCVSAASHHGNFLRVCVSQPHPIMAMFFYVSAKWTPVFYMVQANDPFFTNHKKYDAAVKGTGLQYFLGLGADVNIYDLNKNTPLTLALEQRKGPAILKMLVSKTQICFT